MNTIFFPELQSRKQDQLTQTKEWGLISNAPEGCLTTSFFFLLNTACTSINLSQTDVLELEAAVQTGEGLERPVSWFAFTSYVLSQLLCRGSLSSSPPGPPTAPVHSGHKRQHGPTIPAWAWWSRTISNPLPWGFTPIGAPEQPASSNTSQPWPEGNCFPLSLSPSLF